MRLRTFTWFSIACLCACRPETPDGDADGGNATSGKADGVSATGSGGYSSDGTTEVGTSAGDEGSGEAESGPSSTMSGASGDASTSDASTDTGPQDEPGNDDALFCPVGCSIAACQLDCEPDPLQSENADDGLVQFRRATEVGVEIGDTSTTICGTLHEDYNCGTCWGAAEMDTFWPRISATVTNVDADDGPAHRVRVQYSWNGKNEQGETLTEFSLFTAILVRLDITVRAPDGAPLAPTSESLGHLGINFGGFAPDCSEEPGFFFEFTIDVPIPDSDADTHVVEVVAVGNYE